MASDDFPGGDKITAVLAPDAAATGSLDGSGAKYWYRVSLRAGQSYYFDLEGRDTSKGTLRDPYLYLYDASGQSLASNDDSNGNLNARVVYTASQSGDYFLGAASADTGAAGSFSLSMHDFAAEHPLTSIGTLAVGGSATGELKINGDTGWFSVTLSAGHSYHLDMQGDSNGQGTLHDPVLYLYDSAGNLLGSDDDGGEGWRNSRISYTPTASGAYYLQTAGYESNASGTYQLSASELVDDYPGSTASQGSLSMGGSVSGQVDRNGDRDWFAVSLEAGKSYFLTLAGLGTRQGSLADPYLYLYDSTGNLLSHDDDGGWAHNSRLVFTPSVSGTYYLGAGAFDDADTGTYTLAAEELAGLASAGSLPQGQVTAAGLIHGSVSQAGQEDWYPISLTAANHYYFALEGAGSGHGALDGPVLLLYDSAGHPLAWDSEQTAQDGVTRTEYTAQEDGVYYVDAASLKVDASGSYRLSVIGLALSDFHDDTYMVNPSAQDPFAQAMSGGNCYPLGGVAVPMPTGDPGQAAASPGDGISSLTGGAGQLTAGATAGDQASAPKLASG